MPSFNLGAALTAFKEESEITLLEAGTHTIEITVSKAKESKAGPAITLFGKVYNGPQAGSRVGLGTLSFSEKALWKTFPILRGLGINDDFVRQADSTAEPIKMIADALLGRVAEIKVIVDDYMGEPRNKIDAARLAEINTSAPAPPAAPAAVQLTQPVPAAAPAPARAPAF